MGNSRSVRPYTQHACVIADTDTPWATRLGGEVAYIHNLAMTQIGPLVVFGLLQDKSGASRWEQWSLGKSELNMAGGVLETISQYEKKNYVLTAEMAAQLNYAGNWCIRKAAEFDSGRGKRKPQRS